MTSLPPRRHDAAALDEIAVLHARTPIEGLTATGAQARAWTYLREMVAIRLPEQCPDLIALYCATFGVEPSGVVRDLNEWLPGAAPRVAEWRPR